MKICCELKSGLFIFGRSPGKILTHWFVNERPRLPLENPEPFKVYQIGAAFPHPRTKAFLMLLIAAIEAKFGTSPNIGDPEIPRQRHYWKIINWLEKQGDIKETGIHLDSDNSRELEIYRRIINRRYDTE